MTLEELKNKKVYIYPFSNISLALGSYLKFYDTKLLGFIDKNKKNIPNVKICHLHEIDKYDYIVICSPNHEREIYDFCSDSIDEDKIVCIKIDENGNYIVRKKPAKEIEKPFFETQKYFNQQKATNHKLCDEILFIGYQFIDLNIKYLYMYFLKNSDIKVHLATNNQRDYNLYKNAGFDVVWFDSKEFVDLVLRCKVKVIDQTPVLPFFIDCLKIGKCIQLWHGLAIEKIGILANYKVINYDIFISTSPFTTEYSFSKAYDYKKVLHLGYPRNDILRFDNLPLFNVDLDLLNEIKRKESKYIIYAPTHRAHGFHKNPMDYEKLNSFCEKNDLKFIIKMHPYSAEKLRDDLNTYKAQGKNFKNIILYPSHMDAYAIMKECDMMIVDYSSMYFDFLFVDKPIVFFSYDYEEWVQSEGGVCLDYFAHSPGDHATTFEELLSLITKNLQQDNYQKDREKIKNLMFSNTKEDSCEIIAKEIGNLYNEP